MKSIIIFNESSWNTGIALHVVSQLQVSGHTLYDLRFRPVCATTARILNLSNTPDGGWNPLHNHILAVTMDIPSKELGDILKTVWDKDIGRFTGLALWYTPYSYSHTDQMSKTFCSLLSIPYRGDDQ